MNQAIIHNNNKPIISILAPGDKIQHYSKDAMLLVNDKLPNQNFNQDDFVLIKGVVRNPEHHCNEMFHMLEEGRVIALEQGRGSSFEHMKDESVLFHALIPKQTNSEYKEVLLKGKEWLRKAFAGWHHAYHEVFAAAQVIAIQAL
ncbi:hypothetical protein F0919_10645 [Taibaiella lutea]|uniref:Uncharacterized protein n=1 Tax=Taibaiella lutea TaxID=2608001 RepID=A0A5M6CJ41_9BACT|nr:hypothetical protein [Taibaiella lutea]KAA5535046.1 hypothetical protein F0919_10645 [Taibaiella lutea]